jgi:hypothetical protein
MNNEGIKNYNNPDPSDKYTIWVDPSEAGE